VTKASLTCPASPVSAVTRNSCTYVLHSDDEFFKLVRFQPDFGFRANSDEFSASANPIQGNLLSISTALALWTALFLS
jgi:hypothetical protein